MTKKIGVRKAEMDRRWKPEARCLRYERICGLFMHEYLVASIGTQLVMYLYSLYRTVLFSVILTAYILIYISYQSFSSSELRPKYEYGNDEFKLSKW